MASKKKATKKEAVKQENNEEFIELAKDLKDIVLNLNNRMTTMESLFKRIRSRLGV